MEYLPPKGSKIGVERDINSATFIWTEVESNISKFKSVALSAAGLVSTGCMSGVSRSVGKRPDVLFIAIDDMNDWTTLFDKENPIKTPNLVRLANRGTKSAVTIRWGCSDNGWAA